MTTWLTVSETATKLGRSISWIHKLLAKKDKRLEFQRAGTYYIISAASVRRFKHGKAGNPGLRSKANQNGNHRNKKR